MPKLHLLRRHSDRHLGALALVASSALAMAWAPSAFAGVLFPAPMSGVAITSYTVNGSTPGRAGATGTSLTFSNTDNGSFNPTYALASLTGDSISGGNWSLGAVGSDYGGFAPPPILNLIGAVMNTDSSTPDFAAGDGISVTFVLVFAQTQSFYDLNSLSGANVNIGTATLARSGGPTTDLLTAASGTIFAAGTYTLSMSGTGTGGSNMSLYAGFTPAAVPGGGVAVLVGLLGGRRGRRRR